MPFLRRLRFPTPPGIEALAPALPVFLPFQSSGLGTLGMVLVLVLLVISLGIHEAAHAWVALKCGDSTARDLGRITLNPIPHIDLFMTILLPLGLYVATEGRFVFGGAKPVPVVFHRLRHPWRDMSLVALAGPASNFLLAVLFVAAWHFFVRTGWYNGAAEYAGARHQDLLPLVLVTTAASNLLLAVFNLIPIPPLDGSRVMAYLLPPGMREPYNAVGMYGMVLVFVLIYRVPPFNRFLMVTVSQLLTLVDSCVTLGGRW
ncbi:MAG: site-2 protease family protein [Planctomycetes bacterium]|nr:site-2 protease family protein [Planctomycetota bacterium]